MKKIFTFTAILFYNVAAVFAWPINIPHRIVEFGVSASGGFSNNTLKAEDFLKKEAVIDTAQIAEFVPDNGFQINMNGLASSFFNLNLYDGFHLGFEAGVEASGDFNLSKDIFDFLAKGVNVGQTISVDAKSDSDAFYYMNAAVGWNAGSFHFELVPTLVLPLVHAHAKKAKGYFVNEADGSIVSNVTLEMELNTITSMQPFFDDNFSSKKLTDDMKQGWGFDIGFSIERPIFDMLQGMLYARIPVVPGTLSYSTLMKSTMTYQVEGIKSMFESGTSSPEWKNEDKVYSEEKLKLSRPLRVGGQVAWRPFGRWISFDGMLGFGIKYPYTSEARFYAEYNASAYMSIAHVIGVKASTGYSDEVFKHSVGLILNFRVFELNAGVSVQGGDFANCFKGSGAGAFATICVGW